MKQEHKIIAAVAVLAALALGVYLSRRGSQKEQDEHTVTAAKDLPAIKIAEEDADKITKIVIQSKEKGDVTLEKKGDKWQLVKPVSAAADDTNIKSLLDNAKKLELATVIAETAEVHEKYDLTNDKAVHAELYKGKDKVLDLYFGKGGSRGQMVRLPGSDTVYAAKGYSAFVWAREAHNWREKEILKFDDKKAMEVEVENEHGKYVFTRIEKKEEDKKKDEAKDKEKKDPKDVQAKDEPEEEDEFGEEDDGEKADKKDEAPEWNATFFERAKDSGKLAAAGKKIDRFDPKKVDELLRAYKTLNATNFAKEKDDTGTDDPIKNGGVIRLKLKDKAEYELKIGKKQEGQNRYLAKEGDATVFVITSFAADWATAKVEKFQKPEDKKGDKEGEDDGDDAHEPKPKGSAAPKGAAPPAPAPKSTPAPKPAAPKPKK
jgi:uncharacterized protein DUF4340